MPLRQVAYCSGSEGRPFASNWMLPSCGCETIESVRSAARVVVVCRLVQHLVDLLFGIGRHVELVDRRWGAEERFEVLK